MDKVGFISKESDVAGAWTIGEKLHDLAAPRERQLSLFSFYDPDGTKFVGPTPKDGDVVEIVCSISEPGTYDFKLRVVGREQFISYLSP